MTEPGAPPSGASGVVLDPEKAKAAIAQLTVVRDRLDSLGAQAAQAASLPETAHDLVSKEAFRLLRGKAAGTPGSFADAALAAREHVQRLIEQMEEDASRQRQDDADAARGFADRD